MIKSLIPLVVGSALASVLSTTTPNSSGGQALLDGTNQVGDAVDKTCGQADLVAQTDDLSDGTVDTGTPVAARVNGSAVYYPTVVTYYVHGRRYYFYGHGMWREAHRIPGGHPQYAYNGAVLSGNRTGGRVASRPVTVRTRAPAAQVQAPVRVFRSAVMVSQPHASVKVASAGNPENKL